MSYQFLGSLSSHSDSGAESLMRGRTGEQEVRSGIGRKCVNEEAERERERRGKVCVGVCRHPSHLLPLTFPLMVPPRCSPHLFVSVILYTRLRHNQLHQLNARGERSQRVFIANMIGI